MQYNSVFQDMIFSCNLFELYILIIDVAYLFPICSPYCYNFRKGKKYCHTAVPCYGASNENCV